MGLSRPPSDRVTGDSGSRRRPVSRSSIRRGSSGIRIPPNVVVEQVIVGRNDRAGRRGPIALGTTQRDLEIRYTALSFLAPANVRFRYRLEPYDATWVDAGNRRTAFYTKVPPGQYTFRVTASNNDGVWNEQGAALQLDLAPQLWETQTLSTVRRCWPLASSWPALVGWRVRNLRARAQELGRRRRRADARAARQPSSSSSSRPSSSRSSTARSRGSSPTSSTSSERR